MNRLTRGIRGRACSRLCSLGNSIVLAVASPHVIFQRCRKPDGFG